MKLVSPFRTISSVLFGFVVPMPMSPDGEMVSRVAGVFVPLAVVVKFIAVPFAASVQFSVARGNRPPPPFAKLVAPYPRAAKATNKSPFSTAEGATAVPLARLPRKPEPAPVPNVVVVTCANGWVDAPLFTSRRDAAEKTPIPTFPDGPMVILVLGVVV